MRFFDLYKDWQEKKHGVPIRTFFLIVLVPLFLFIVFYLIPVYLSKEIDKVFYLENVWVLPGWLNLFLGVLLMGLGFLLYSWTIASFHIKGEGTPAPPMPTRHVVSSGPYKYSRNPMVGGILLVVVGIGIILNSMSYIVAGLLLPILYLIYIKLVEEKELELRFGKRYVEYKKRTPFLIPKPMRRQ